VAHDHRARAVAPDDSSSDEEAEAIDLALKPKQIKLKGQKPENEQELKLECIKRIRGGDVPVRILTKLFGISYPRIKRIREATHLDVDQLFTKYKPRG